MNELLNTLRESTIVIPTYEIMTLLLLQTFCYLFRSLRVGLLDSYVFTYSLGWRFIRTHFGWAGVPYLYGYCVLGMLVLALALYSLLTDHESA